MLSFPETRQGRVSFTVQDSTISGKKEICYRISFALHVVRNGLLIYSHIVSGHPKETLYSKHDNTMTLQMIQRTISRSTTTPIICNTSSTSKYSSNGFHFRQSTRKKGIMSRILPRIYLLFVDGVNFDILPMYFSQDSCTSSCYSSLSQSVSMESARSKDRTQSRSRSREGTQDPTNGSTPKSLYACSSRSTSCERRPILILGRNY